MDVGIDVFQWRQMTRALRWQVGDMVVSASLLIASFWLTSYFAVRTLWMYVLGLAVLQVSLLGAAVTSFLGTRGRRLAANVGGSTWIALAFAAAILFTFAPPFHCERKVCRAEPDYCVHSDGQVYYSNFGGGCFSSGDYGAGDYCTLGMHYFCP